MLFSRSLWINSHYPCSTYSRMCVNTSLTTLAFLFLLFWKKLLIFDHTSRRKLYEINRIMKGGTNLRGKQTQSRSLKSHVPIWCCRSITASLRLVNVLYPLSTARLNVFWSKTSPFSATNKFVKILHLSSEKYLNKNHLGKEEGNLAIFPELLLRRQHSGYPDSPGNRAVDQQMHWDCPSGSARWACTSCCGPFG